jgi:hypothetical protein
MGRYMLPELSSRRKKVIPSLLSSFLSALITGTGTMPVDVSW